MSGNGDYSSVTNGIPNDDYLFDMNSMESILKDYSLEDPKLFRQIYNDKYLVRPLSVLDYRRGYIDLLRQLTECGAITFEGYQQRFQQMKQSGETYFIIVIEDLYTDQQIVGSATLVCEQKFIRQLAKRGRIEDVVIHDRARGQQLGKLLIGLLTRIARDFCGCYKVSLECKDHLVKFYQQFGYFHEDQQNYLCQRFKNISSQVQSRKNEHSE